MQNFTNQICELQNETDGDGVNELKMVEETCDIMHYNLIYTRHHMQDLDEGHDVENITDLKRQLLI